jgi:hypothetical protein
MTSNEVHRLRARVDAQDESIRAVGDTMLDVKDVVDGHTGQLDTLIRTVDGHTATLAEHTATLAEHGRMLTEILRRIPEPG